MKKKWIILSIVGIILVSTILIITVSKNSEKYIMYDGIMLAMTLTDSEGNTSYITEFPSGTNYTVKVDCGDTAIGRWLGEEWKLAVENIKGDVKCNIDFYTRTDSDKLSNVIKGLSDKSFINNGLCTIDEYTDYTNCENNGGKWYKISNLKDVTVNNVSLTNTSVLAASTSEYNKVIQGEDYGFSVEGTTTGAWVSTNAGISYSESLIHLSPKETAGYQICYKVSSEQDYDFAYIYLNGATLMNVSGTSSTSFTCVALGNLTNEDVITVSYKKDAATDSGNDNFIFYIQKGTYNGGSAVYEEKYGIRYNGESPNNYVWFNNEYWRIIGLIPVCTTASNGTCSSRTSLVKIIRAVSIGGLAYDAKSSGYTGLWGSNTLYTLLNTYYYGKSDGTDTTSCYGTAVIGKAKCDYTKIGISSSSTDYNGRMVESVYWNIGAVEYNPTSETAYEAEIGKVTTSKAKIGIMSLSDFGYAPSSGVVIYNNTLLGNYGGESRTTENWLYSQGDECTNTQYSKYTDRSVYVKYSGYPGYDKIGSDGCSVRPVVYLNSEVYKISGSGTMADPYIIGM